MTVLRNDANNVIEIIKSKRAEPDQVFHYTKQTFENVEVSDEAFEQLDVGLKKQSKINDYNEVTYYFTDLEGREIETIPPKLASATQTEISLVFHWLIIRFLQKKNIQKVFRNIRVCLHIYQWKILGFSFPS